jgi:hypothetical protein
MNVLGAEQTVMDGIYGWNTNQQRNVLFPYSLFKDEPSKLTRMAHRFDFHIFWVYRITISNITSSSEYNFGIGRQESFTNRGSLRPD